MLRQKTNMFKLVRFWQNTNMSASDRRKKIRVPISRPIRHSTYQVLGTPVFQESSAVDLSSGGISFEASREYQKGNLVLLEVEMLEKAVKLLVCVAWAKKLPDGRYNYGAELVAIDPEEKKQLQTHLAKMIKAATRSKRAKKARRAKKKSTKKKSVKKRSKR